MNLELNDATRQVIQQERAALADLHGLLNRLDAQEKDLLDLKTALNDLEGIFMLVVCGEYNAGKSSLLNALLGHKVMLEGVTPTTDRVTIVTYGPTERNIEESNTILRREYPAEILRDLAFVDTPGTNAIVKGHQELTERFIPRADLVLFVTSADRPFTESERTFLQIIGGWGKKIVIVVNKMDIVEEADERQKIMDFVRNNARTTLGSAPQVFPTKAKAAFRAKQTLDPAQLAGTGLPELEAYIESTLAASERLKLKLQNPLGVALHIAEKYKTVIKERLGLLSDDKRTLDEVDRQLAQYDKDMKREFDNYLTRLKTVLLEVERRGEVFFDDTIKFRNIPGLLNSDKVQKDFEARVIRNADKDIDVAVHEMVDWFIQRNLNLWEDVVSFVNGRRKAGEERVIGEVGGRFQYDRDALIRNLRQSAEDVMKTYDEDAEGRRLSEKLQQSVFSSGLGLVGGVGLGAAVVALVSSTAWDITGITLGLTLAGAGLYMIPRRRQKAKKELHEKMQELRDGLGDSIGKQFEQELRRASEKLHSSVQPYTRFVRSEVGRLEELEKELDVAQGTLEGLKRSVDAK
ncbi:MAG: dynamin family protein [Trueperaceae bacterium]